MGPTTLIDKCAIQRLHFDEVAYLDRYYSLILSPILLRELLSTLAKEPEENKDWEKTLSILAAKVDTMNSYIPPHVNSMVRGNLLGGDLPMTGQVPVAGGKTVRSRDGTYGVIFEEQPEKAILRNWKSGNFSPDTKESAQLVRTIDHSVDLEKLKQEIEAQVTHVPKFQTLGELVKWLDETYFSQVSQEFHLRNMAKAFLTPEETEQLISRWKSRGSPLFSEFCPYAFHVYRCNTIYYIGLGKGLISTSRKANTHLDMQYIYYLPFCRVFTTSDKFLLDFAKYFVRPNQSIVSGDDLKVDLRGVSDFFKNLTDDQKKEFRSDFGNYPPEEGAPLTASVWKKYMGPRPKAKEHAPEISPERNAEIVQKLNRFLRDSINVDTNRTNDQSAAEKWLKVGIIERGLHFVNETLQIVGLSETQDWSQVKKTFSSEHVKNIFNLHADIWRPDNDQHALAEGLRNSERSRFLYLGDIEPEEIAQKVWRWSLHFDQILMVDPFHTPWAMKEDYNPLANPVQYETDTLKLVYLLVLLYPLIASQKVVFIPDPSDFNPAMKKAFFEIAKKNMEDPDLKAAIKVDFERLKKYQFMAQVRVYSRLPRDQRIAQIKKLFGDQDLEAHLRGLAHLRETDPLCLDRDMDLSKGEMILTRSGASFEIGLILSALYDATPISALECRYSQFRRAGSQPSDHTKTIFQEFRQTPGFQYLDPFFSSAMSEKDALVEFRGSMKLILAEDKVPDELTPENIRDIFGLVEEDCKILTEIYTKSVGLDGTDVVKKFDLEILYSDTGFATPNVTQLAESWFPGQRLTYPKHFIRIPDQSN